WEHADEVRVFGSLLTPTITTGSAAIRRVALAVRQFYGDTTFTDTLQQDVVETALIDTAATRFGAGWQLAELGRLVTGQFAGGDSAAVLLLGDGSYSVYTKSGAGPWTPPPGETARLVRQTTLLAGARWVLYLN